MWRHALRSFSRVSVSHGLQATLKGWHMHTGDSLTCFNSAVNSQPSSSRGPRMPRKLGTVELCRAVAMPTPTSLTEVYNAASLACDTTPRSAQPQQRHASNATGCSESRFLDTHAALLQCTVTVAVSET